ncbi:hypothetical protein SAMN05660493_01136 [Epilithonimonas bovis DSM 19482]|jgi:hypothetical protein|uniref:Uncharacterized protein n=1 Tax=Epilithonimonas bovis DSM 19482 TaxID=1121284 RepID=A0A1U7PSA7_9FLAO|nr:hypothetical protein [Epilithonimonas bovis]QIY82301.1 hypothetical protein HER18_01425 [Chryseobacterium sp. NEB161]SIT96455.1 hypothetical protein SAMN05660493_01136 [Epilithonimonas bovis DSM 19482]HBR12876.1 hypothetical protein [Chryseobacterium sp.]
MIPEDNINEQNRNLKEMNYKSSEDVFNQEKPIPLDENGNPIYDENETNEYDMEMDLDVPGSDADNDSEEIGSEDEENNYWSESDQDDDHEEENDDLLE